MTQKIELGNTKRTKEKCLKAGANQIAVINGGLSIFIHSLSDGKMRLSDVLSKYMFQNGEKWQCCLAER